ncbi:hypothetical protein IQ254_21280 [Nodosilinea sp. LEGE 07088]|uniref:hypothetical protein n=1 Tax=Nodosilinea sp. LEGE 07088 TaxID=2777968 RepID=UPI00187FA52D|nr:hypothetical protein [Nodosilinea sp. LEGE 07088]MBE9139697.1 hypothetical protein [Nodosilinea sp. LEGE 07088]
MQPYPHYFPTPHLAWAASLGLLIVTPALGLATQYQQNAQPLPQVTNRSDDDRGSGRLRRVPAIAKELSFRGSGRIAPNPPNPDASWHLPTAYRGSGRIAQPAALPPAASQTT